MNILIVFSFLSWFVTVCGTVGPGPYQSSFEPKITKRSVYSEPTKEVPGPEKNYTGIRLRDDSLLLIYHHDQTIAVVEVAKNRELFTCELLEVRTKRDRDAALSFLKILIPTQIRISFADMIELMSECQKLDFQGNLSKELFAEGSDRKLKLRRRQLTNLLSGLFPGTKWCGTGDNAGSYYDLGTDRNLDKCCRTHDLCPVKIAGLRTQYNITNYSPYTRSHCRCEDEFYSCLKKIGTFSSNLLGNLYFNVAQITCVEDVPQANDTSMNFKKMLVSKNKQY